MNFIRIVVLLILFVACPLGARASGMVSDACIAKLTSGHNKLRQKISVAALRSMEAGWKANPAQITNENYALLVDYTLNSKSRRAFVIDLKKCEVAVANHVIHGGAVYNPVAWNAGEPNHNGMLQFCMNHYGTRENMTRPGAYVTAGCHSTSQDFPFLTDNCRAIVLHGLDQTNYDAEASGVVLHEHSAIPDDDSIKPVGQGCPAFPPGQLKALLRFDIFSGMLVFVYAPQCGETSDDFLQVALEPS